MIEVLWITVHDLQRGGVERCFESWAENFPQLKELHITWYCPGEILNPDYADEIKHLGINLVTGNIKGEKKYKNKKFQNDIHKLIRTNHYDIVHVNTGLPLPTYYALKVAKKEKVPVRIAHAHSYVKQKTFSLKVYFTLLRFLNNRLSTYRLATSKIAGRFMFGKGYHVLKNGIDVGRFDFSTEQRQLIRKQYGVEGQKIVGYIGTLTQTKNPLFALKVFEEYHKTVSRSILWMFGKGPLENAIREKIAEYDIQNSVLLLGETDNVGLMMQAMDVLLFPSFAEGFGLVSIEAQATGLPVLASDGVPPETHLTPLIDYLPLDDHWPWVNRMKEIFDGHEPRRNHQADVSGAGYDIKDIAAELQNIYITSMQTGIK